MNLNYDVGKPYLFIEVVKQPQTPYVLDYGADPLGWFGSTFAIQSAINDARATGGYVTLPTGRYKITSPNHIHNSTQFIKS